MDVGNAFRYKYRVHITVTTIKIKYIFNTLFRYSWYYILLNFILIITLHIKICTVVAEVPLIYLINLRLYVNHNKAFQRLWLDINFHSINQFPLIFLLYIKSEFCTPILRRSSNESDNVAKILFMYLFEGRVCVTLAWFISYILPIIVIIVKKKKTPKYYSYKRCPIRDYILHRHQ